MAWGLASQRNSVDKAAKLSVVESPLWLRTCRIPVINLRVHNPDSAISKPILQCSAGRLNISYERLLSIQKLLELWLVAPTDETIAVATGDSVCMDFRWWQPGPFGSLAFTFLTTEIEVPIFHRILLVVSIPRHFPMRA